jgi:chaperonin GroEL
MKPDKIVSINTEENPSEAFERMMRGVDLLANTVKQTIGPFGKNVLLEKSGGRITNDGLTIAREIQAKDEVEDLALRIVREAAIKTNEDAGDGTTTATILAQAILHACIPFMARGTQLAKKSVMSLKRQIEKETMDAIEELKKMAKPVETEEQLIEVARVSVEDEELASLIGKAQWELGKEGVIIPEENPEPVCTVERIQGIRIDNGAGTSMVFNDPERQRLVVENAPVLLTNYTLNSLAPLQKVLQQLVEKGKTDIVIFARAFSSEAIQQVMENHNRGIKIYPMQAPYVNQREVFKDLEAVLGGYYIHDETNTLDSVRVSHFGNVKKLIGYRYSAVLTGEGKEDKVTARIEHLKKEIEGEPSKFQKKAIEARIAQLENGFALLKIGSLSDSDRKYKFDKAEDAVNTVRSALQEGTVPGAGQAMKTIADNMPDDALLKRPLQAPYDIIMGNAGGEFEIEPWVRNSLKVERVALENAAKVAAALVTAGGVVATEKIRPLDQLLDKLK